MDQSQENYKYLFKLILIGNSSVGKSSLLRRFVDKKWNDNFVPTIGVDFKIKTIRVDNQNIKLQIWDTAGQERFKHVTSSYYKGAHGILIVYDVTCLDSFKSVSNWLVEIEKNASKNITMILLGNKTDLNSKRKVSTTQGEELADAFKMKFIESSARKNTNVEECFILLTREILNKKGEAIEYEETKKKLLIKNGNDVKTQKEKEGCCN